MTPIIDEQVTAELDDGFVVFRLGMRINSFWKVHEWIPILRAATSMIDEIDADPETGFLAVERRLGIRNLELIQYWRSFEALRTYALDPEFSHAPSMRETLERMEETDAVGIWHETYIVDDDSYETLYYNAPPTGLGKAGTLHRAEGAKRTAAGRLGVTDGEDFSYGSGGVASESVGGE